jgi:hypothetical protein
MLTNIWANVWKIVSFYPINFQYALKYIGLGSWSRYPGSGSRGIREKTIPDPQLTCQTKHSWDWVWDREPGLGPKKKSHLWRPWSVLFALPTVWVEQVSEGGCSRLLSAGAENKECITLSTVKLWTAVVKKSNLPVLRIRIRDPVPFWPLDPGSGMGLFRIPGTYFEELLDKKFYYSLKIDQFFLYHFRTKII